MRADEAAMERRMTDGLTAAEGRISPKLEKLADLYVAIIERISRLEGTKAAPTK
jgi:hypothetical protein